MPGSVRTAAGRPARLRIMDVDVRQRRSVGGGWLCCGRLLGSELRSQFTQFRPLCAILPDHPVHEGHRIVDGSALLASGAIHRSPDVLTRNFANVSTLAAQKYRHIPCSPFASTDTPAISEGPAPCIVECSNLPATRIDEPVACLEAHGVRNRAFRPRLRGNPRGGRYACTRRNTLPNFDQRLPVRQSGLDGREGARQPGLKRGIGCVPDSQPHHLQSVDPARPRGEICVLRPDDRPNLTRLGLDGVVPGRAEP